MSDPDQPQPAQAPLARVRKAIIPAAGMGTRFLPATKSMPKEMLPIVDTPVIQFVIEEAVASGIEDVLIVTGRTKRSIEDHFDYAPELEIRLQEAGKLRQAEQVRDIADRCRIFYIRQKEPRGLGDAVRIGRRHVGDEPFAVLLGDTIIEPTPNAPPGLRQLIDVHDRLGGSVVAVRRVPQEWVSRYGIVDGPEIEGQPNLRRLNRLIEKPAPEDAPTNLAIAGRYIFTPEIFDCIDQTREGVGGEIQLTDAMNMLAAAQPMHALAWDATRWDIGDRLDYAKCYIDAALKRTDTGPELKRWLADRLGG